MCVVVSICPPCDVPCLSPDDRLVFYNYCEISMYQINKDTVVYQQLNAQQCRVNIFLLVKCINTNRVQQIFVTTVTVRLPHAILRFMSSQYKMKQVCVDITTSKWPS